MLDYKDIITKHYALGMSGRKIAESLKVSKSGVNDFLQAFQECPVLSYPLPEGITNYGIAALVYLDRLYVHKDYQHRGVATAICDALEQNNKATELTTHASITARPFFEKRGYTVVREQQVERRGELLTNFVMRKERGK